MKKSLTLFSFIFILSLVSLGLKAQTCGSKVSVNVGEIRVGDTFTMSLSSGETVVGTSITLWHEGGARFRLREADVSNGQNIPIGEVATRSSSSSSLRCYTIYGIVKQ